MNEQVREKLVRKVDKVAIIGTSDSKVLAPYGNPDFECWGVNNLYAFAPPNSFARWFEIHQFQYDGKNVYRRGKKDFRGKPVADYIAELDSLGCPVYMHEDNPQLPGMKNVAPFPFKALVSKYGNYFTNTIAWQTAFAMELGFKEIHVYGVDMAVGGEYQHQRASCEFFLGLALGKGIKIYIPPEADLLKTRFMYAYEELKESDFTKKCNMVMQQMQQRQQQAVQIREMESKKVEQYIGAQQAMKEMMKIWESVQPKN